MTSKTRIADLPELDAADYLSTEQDIAEYIAAVQAENDPALLAAALEDVARARARSVENDRGFK